MNDRRTRGERFPPGFASLIRRILWLHGAEAIARVEAAGLDERRLAPTYRTLINREKELAAVDPSAFTVPKICREVLDQVPPDSPLTRYREPLVRGPRESPADIWQRLEKAGVDIETNVYRLAASHSSHADIANAAGPVHPALLEAVEGFMDAFDDGLTREDLLQIIRSQADVVLPARRMLARHRNWQQRSLAQLKLLADALADLVNGLDDEAASRARRKQDGPAERE